MNEKITGKLGDIWASLVPEYKSQTYSGLHLEFEWQPHYARLIREISEKRSVNRIQNYIIPEEIERVKQRRGSNGNTPSSIRFGVKKEGHGYHGQRGDFCLIGGVVTTSKLLLMYRSLELIGGLAYDLVLMHSLGKQLGIQWKKIEIIAWKANVFALKKNSNEKLYPKLQEIFNGQET